MFKNYQSIKNSRDTLKQNQVCDTKYGYNKLYDNSKYAKVANHKIIDYLAINNTSTTLITFVKQCIIIRVRYLYSPKIEAALVKFKLLR